VQQVLDDLNRRQSPFSKAGQKQKPKWKKISGNATFWKSERNKL